MTLTRLTLFTALLTGPALAHSDGSFHTHGVELWIPLAALAALGTLWHLTRK